MIYGAISNSCQQIQMTTVTATFGIHQNLDITGVYLQTLLPSEILLSTKPLS